MQVKPIHTQDLTDAARAVVSRADVLASDAWLDIYKGQNRLMGIYNDNQELVGTFNLFAFRKYGLTILINPPFTPHINLQYTNPAQSPSAVHSFNKQVMQAIASYLLATRAHYIKLNFAGSVVDTQVFSWKQFTVANRFTYILQLQLSEEELFANLSPEKRKSLRKAEKDGLRIEEAGDYQQVFDLIRQSLQRNDKFHNQEIIRSMVLRFSSPQHTIAFLAKDQEGKALAAAYCICHGGKAYYLFGGFNEVHKHHGAGVSCMWACIKKAKAMGLSEFDFEGSMVPEIEKYFREFGGELKPLQEITYKRFPYKQLSLLLNRP